MKKLIAKIMVFTLIFNYMNFTLASASYAANEAFQNSQTTVTVDLKDLDEVSRNRILDSMKKVEEKKNSLVSNIPPVDNIKKFTEYGTAVASTIQAVCKVLNVEVNSFVKTPVGSLVMWMVIYHVIGKDLIKVGFAFLIWFMVTGILAFTFSRFHLPCKVVTKDEVTKEKKIEYIQKYKWEKSEAKVLSAWMHGLAFFCITFILIMRVI